MFLTEFGFGFLDSGKEGCARDAYDVCDIAVGITCKAEFPNAATVWKQLIKAFQKLLKDDTVDHDRVEVG